MNAVAESIRVPLVGLCGPARSGKTTIANAIGWEAVGFADALKEDVARLIPPGMAKEDCRPLWVAYGRLWRAHNPHHWIQRLKLPAGVPAIIHDVRHWNEIEHVQGLGGTVFRIHRAGIAPANDEEAQNLSIIDADYELPAVRNDETPRDAAKLILEYLAKHEPQRTKRKRQAC